MKQDLEKTETVYFSNFLSKKKLSKVPRNVNTVPGGTTATPADPTGKTEYQKKDGIDFKPKTNGYPRLDLNFPDYDEEEDDFDTVRYSLASRLVSKTSTETPSTSFEKPDLSSDNRSLIPCSEVKWIRNIGLKGLEVSLLTSSYFSTPLPKTDPDRNMENLLDEMDLSLPHSRPGTPPTDHNGTTEESPCQILVRTTANIKRFTATRDGYKRIMETLEMDRSHNPEDNPQP
ncbi:hypothetical protein TNCT_653511 [Trichonephila clavata]|uniref:Uncharacterized protein n=1 Tax=Trichonephila clavata TaxID=2740835 RepID=A0A8X6KYX3_TRICU|nr:hypothetical protein TNCT_653511 [Trichonephila clavata]